MIETFVFVLLLFALIGILSARKKSNNTKDYLLAGQDVQPWLVALSAVATNNSGYMFIGMIGYTYKVGLSSIWLMIGWIAGDFIASLYVSGKLRSYAARYKLYSFGSLLSNNQGKNSRIIQVLTGIISLIFLSSYAAAQLSAGGKALFATLNWDQYIGIIIGAIVVVVYCFSGGIRASIWTDAAQSIVMIAAMFILMVFAIQHQGGFQDSLTKLTEVSANYMTFSDNKTFFPFILFIAGWLFAGYGVIGQAHIMVRYMSLNKKNNMKQVRTYYYSWFTAFYIMAIAVGLLSRITLNNPNSFDPELALPLLSLQLLPDYLIGIMLAGIFAATISTADSLIISCTAALSNDIFPSLKLNYKFTKLLTIVVALFATIFAIYSDKGVFEIVIYAWAILGSSFGPLLSLRMLKKNVPETTAIIMITGAGLLTFIWNIVGWGEIVYEMLPGILFAYSIYFVSLFFKKSASKSASHS